MIPSERTMYALDHFIRPSYFRRGERGYRLMEKEQNGAGELVVTVPQTNICIQNFDKVEKETSFFWETEENKLAQKVDHCLFYYDDRTWTLVLIEMKTSVGARTWLQSIKPKIRSSILRMRAFAAVCGIHVDRIEAYTTYAIDKFQPAQTTTSPIAYRMPIRKRIPQERCRDPYQDEWLRDRAYINLGEEIVITHHRVQMVKQDDVLTGRIDST